MVVVLSGEAVASHASFVYQPKPADPEEVELAASAKSFLWRKHKPWACMPVRQSKLFTLDEQNGEPGPYFFLLRIQATHPYRKDTKDFCNSSSTPADFAGQIARDRLPYGG